MSKVDHFIVAGTSSFSQGITSSDSWFFSKGGKSSLREASQTGLYGKQQFFPTPVFQESPPIYVSWHSLSCFFFSALFLRCSAQHAGAGISTKTPTIQINDSEYQCPFKSSHISILSRSIHSEIFPTF